MADKRHAGNSKSSQSDSCGSDADSKAAESDANGTATAKSGEPARTEAPSGKNIVIFSDGTGQEGGIGNNTNVYALFNMILDRSADQISFYDQGLGTGDNRLWGSIAGAGISENVGETYQFLSDNFQAGDRIFLFGFSRGATTVRSVAGFIHLFGILPRSRPELFDRAWGIYRIRNEQKRAQRADEFIHSNHTMWTNIRFLGVWDTVAALALPFKPLEMLRNLFPWFHYSFHDLKMSRSVEYGRHALAIDDERRTFHPVLFEEQGARKRAPSLAGGDLFSSADVTDLYLAAQTLLDVEGNPVSRRLSDKLHPSSNTLLEDFRRLEGRLASPKQEDELRDAIVEDFNKIIESGEAICNTPDSPDPACNQEFATLKLSAATREALDRISSAFSPSDINRTNRLLLEDVYSLKPRIKQVWFSGMHSDVGGGYADNELAHIPLLWMMSEAIDLGLRIYSKHRVDLRPDATGTMHDSRSGPGRFYRRSVRLWDTQQHQGRPPLVHRSVKERERAVHGYKPWIGKLDCEDELWPVRLQRSIQYNDDRVWRRPLWGWGADFDVEWSDIERISLNESKTAITLHMKTTGPIHVQGSLPRNLQAFVNRLERIREHHRLQTVDGLFEGVQNTLEEKVDKLQEYVKKLDGYIQKDEDRAVKTEQELRELREIQSTVAKLIK